MPCFSFALSPVCSCWFVFCRVASFWNRTNQRPRHKLQTTCGDKFAILVLAFLASRRQAILVPGCYVSIPVFGCICRVEISICLVHCTCPALLLRFTYHIRSDLLLCCGYCWPRQQYRQLYQIRRIFHDVPGIFHLIPTIRQLPRYLCS